MGGGVYFRRFPVNNNSMNRLATTLLFIPLAVLLTLPHGWCCLLADVHCCGQQTEPITTQDNKSQSKDDCCCCDHSRDQQSDDERQPHPPIQPRMPTQPECCCVELPRTPGHSLNVPVTDQQVAVLDVLPILQETTITRTFLESSAHSYLTHRIHLIQCVWLC